LIYGQVRLANPQLPEINKQLITANVEKLVSGPDSRDSVIQYNSSFNQDSFTNSFSNQPLVLYSRDEIVLENVVISGNVRIKSDRAILVRSTAILKDALLYAPKVILMDNTKGAFQVFASDSIAIGENCQLNLPSAIALIQDKEDFPGYISIKRKTVLSGAVVLYLTKSKIKNPSIIYIDKEVVINGQVYSSDFIELRGSVYGPVYTRGTILRTPSAIYENHLLDAIINPSKLSPYYAGVSLLEQSKRKEVIKWLE
jgi:hypothetical protein